MTRATAVFSTFWLVGVVLMTLSYVGNPVDPSLIGTDRYGQSYSGELQSILTVTLAEIAISLAILRPWNYRRSWWRPLLLLVILTPWLLLWGVVGMHAGPTTHTHSLWLMLYWIGLLGAISISGCAAVLARRRSEPHVT
jgi:hypothetical protein